MNWMLALRAIGYGCLMALGLVAFDWLVPPLSTPAPRWAMAFIWTTIGYWAGVRHERTDWGAKP